MTETVLDGTCRTCGRPLVQVVGERTYHPAVVMPATEPCPKLLPIGNSRHLSFNVPDSEFVTTDHAAQKLAEMRDLRGISTTEYEEHQP
jgi:hypothetical protein